MVPEATANVVRVYEPAVSTSVPARTISGGAALLDFPTDTAIGPEGNIYVLNNGPTPSTRTVTVYPPTANGAVEPVRTITIPFVTDLFSLAVDDGGHVYVGGTGGHHGLRSGARRVARPRSSTSTAPRPTSPT